MAQKEKNYEKLQFAEQEETNFILWLNTGFTILTGLATVVLAVLQYIKK